MRGLLSSSEEFPKSSADFFLGRGGRFLIEEPIDCYMFEGRGVELI